MADFKSQLISGVTASAVTNQRFKKELGLGSRQQISYMVLRAKLDGKTYYCCWSGGCIEDGEVKFTEVGSAALETLVSLPVGKDDALVMQELKLGDTPLQQKVKNALRKLPSGSKVCFFGDMSGELDGHMHQAFNVVGTVELTAEV
jgi:hypothetical protein